MLTNEEKRIGIYEGNRPTRPETVTPETPLDALNLNWTERDLPERERTNMYTVFIRIWESSSHSWSKCSFASSLRLGRPC